MVLVTNYSLFPFHFKSAYDAQSSRNEEPIFAEKQKTWEGKQYIYLDINEQTLHLIHHYTYLIIKFEINILVSSWSDGGRDILC